MQPKTTFAFAVSLRTARWQNVRTKFAHAVQEHAYITAEAEGTEPLADPVHGQFWSRREKSRSDAVAPAYGG
jgi:hypothetical protein